MSYVKITNGAVARYPYSAGQLRRDNPNVSFPRNVPIEIMRRYGMRPVTVEAMPEYNALTEKVTTATTPTRGVVRLMTEADATDPITEEVNTDLIGTPIYGNDWVLTRTVVELTEDEIAANAVEAAEANRKKRDDLIAATDWWASSDLTMTAEQTTYRQSLRDITSHANWPNLSDNDLPVAP
jgi:hypothetical protein